MSESKWAADQIPDLSGRTFVVTGAGSGLGLAMTEHLARHGAHVVMAVGSVAKGSRAAARIGNARLGASLDVRHLQLSDLDSVRDFTAGVHIDDVPVDVLVNNASQPQLPRTLSTQGRELQFAGDHLGRFALTGLLLDVLHRGRDPRVVTVSSLGHRGGRIDFDNLNNARSYSPARFHSQSSFADVLLALELDRRLRAAGSQVRSLLAHPGLATTNLQRTGPTGLIRLGGAVVNLLFAQEVERGVLPQQYAATAPVVQGGQFFGPGGWRQLRGHPRWSTRIPRPEIRMPHFAYGGCPNRPLVCATPP